ncbi:transmembrane protein, putative (macronuclear) [Tetrahymena thermophila SB210]|uniref:Transmembrane protein, putative n=1 Tax=Tetrahymena thermophila (strain SB210) TaxID=312017 RepID=Q22UG0_TETTS|nr:transmembrane protein, putative [Tetrahymena thermophila SB210]EAR89010.3 transmembrane protein, putative [Tetrahymena thermophila SB210]|eukprot:XP_001009255.3 transmembrane protein, putative [Tetrahymena thermophila SB210]
MIKLLIQKQFNPNQYLSITINLNKFINFSIFLWVIIEIRKIVSIFVIYQFSQQFWSFICLGSIKKYNQKVYSSPTAFEIVLIVILIIRQVLDTTLSLNSYYMIFKSIQISRKKIAELSIKHELYMNNFPKEFDISTISQILDQSGKFQKSFKGKNY